MNNDIKIRQASRADVSAIAKMQVSAWEDDIHKQPIDQPLKRFFLNELKKRWKKQLERSIQVLVIEEMQAMLGFLAFYPIVSEPSASQPIAEIRNIYIIPARRHQGLGKLLCHTMIDKIKHFEAKMMIVWVLDGDMTAKRFYEKLGFFATEAVRVDKLANGMALKEICYQIRL